LGGDPVCGDIDTPLLQGITWIKVDKNNNTIMSGNNPFIRPKTTLMIKYLERLMSEEELEDLIDRYMDEKKKEYVKRADRFN